MSAPVEISASWYADPESLVQPKAQPSDAEIRLRAYANWEARGRVNGDPLRDWIQAERELREEMQSY